MWKGKNSHGIMKKDGEINFSKLEQQMDNAVEADKLYWTRNDAKIRAVTNKVASYEEFEDIVKASHLKPLEKGDRISDIKVFKQPWNISSVSGSAINTGSKGATEIPNVSITNINQFNRMWKTQCKDALEKFRFLVELDCNQILKIFHAEIALGLLGEFVTVFNGNYHPERAEAIGNILHTLTKCGRFDLSLQFLSQKERESLSSLLDSLSQDWDSSNTDWLKSIYIKV